MADFLKDIGNMIASFAFVDYVLYFAVIALIMLIVSLIYVMREEKEEKEIKEKEDKKESIMPIELPKKEEEIDLKSIVNTINENPSPLVDMTAYEEEQEQKAIISYDELLKESRQNVINYEREEMVDDLIPVKKISVNITDEIEKEPPENTYENKPLILFSYEKEEAFLKALQQLNELLN